MTKTAHMFDVNPATVSRLVKTENYKEFRNRKSPHGEKSLDVAVENYFDKETKPQTATEIYLRTNWKVNPDTVLVSDQKKKHELIGLIQDEADWTITQERVSKIADAIINKYKI